MKLVQKLVNFNGKMEMTVGIVIEVVSGDYVVDFQHDGISFRGIWKAVECE